jgi:hypothetical protein
VGRLLPCRCPCTLFFTCMFHFCEAAGTCKAEVEHVDRGASTVARVSAIRLSMKESDTQLRSVLQALHGAP